MTQLHNRLHNSLTVFILTKMFIAAPCGATVALVLQLLYSLSSLLTSGLPVTNSFPEAPTPHPPPNSISNKFLYRHCHVDTAKDVDMLNR